MLFSLSLKLILLIEIGVVKGMERFLYKPFTCNTINQVVSEEKIKKWNVYGQRTCDGNISDDLLGQGELKNHSPTLFIDKLHVKLKFASALTFYFCQCGFRYSHHLIEIHVHLLYNVCISV